MHKKNNDICETSVEAQKRKSLSKENNSWYHFNSESGVVIVFVHGFFSNSKNCWQSKYEVYWPDLILSDSRFSNPSIFLAGYYTSVDSRDYRIADCAAEVYNALNRQNSNGIFPPIANKNIIFVCHSLGGVVIRYMLESKVDAFKDKSIGIALMATPSLGSDYANSMGGVSKYFRNGLADQLKSMSDALVDLDARFKDLIQSKRIAGLVGVEAIEHQAIFHMPWCSWLKTIVSKESAARYFGYAQTLPRTNHFTVVKPDSLNHPSHQFLVDFYTRCASTVMNAIIDDSLHSDASNTTEVLLGTQKSNKNLIDLILFDILGVDNIPYYLERSVDGELSSKLKGYSVWVTGPSGCGKTSFIRNFIYKSQSKPLEVCLSYYKENLTTSNCITEIVTTAKQVMPPGTTGDNTIQSLVSLLASYAYKSTVVLHIDEVPVTEEQSSVDDFVVLMSDIINLVKQRTSRADLRILISSVFTPNSASFKIRKKMNEQLCILPLTLWPNTEIEQLLQKVSTHFKYAIVPPSFESKLITECNGSPRFLKMYLKNILIQTSFPINYEQVLEITRDQFVV